MADNFITVPLNRGLDFVTPPMIAETGTLLSALNYEVTSALGYSRYDGYERCDGGADGGISTYYTVTLIPTDEELATTPAPPVGSTIAKVSYRTNGVYDVNDITAREYAGVVLSWDFDGTTAQLVYAPTGSSVGLPAGAQLEINGNIYFTTTTIAVDGRTTATSASAYLESVRSYSASLRALVQTSPSAIAGVHYSRDHLYQVVDCPAFTVDTSSLSSWVKGDRVAYSGKLYDLLEVTDNEVVLRPTEYSFTTASTTKLYKVGPAGTVVADVDFTGVPAQESAYGYLIRRNGVSEPRGYTVMKPSYAFRYGNGSGEIPALTGLGAGNYTLALGTSGETLTVKLTQVSHDFGDYATSDAGGIISLAVVSASPGATRNYPMVGDVLTIAGGTVELETLVDIGSLAGTKALAPTKASLLASAQGYKYYQFLTANFYGRADLRQFYGANGVTRAFWCDGETYGSIVTMDDTELDTPKYIAFHANTRLALGFDAGSVMLSVVGQPYNFSGVQGAMEVATGDNITGLIESYNDSTIVFGRRSIRRITGTDESTLELQTISANSGALDYTCASIGSTVVFTSPTGVSTLDQAAEYGDFVGQNATSSIYTWLNPRLTVDTSTIEPSGVVCAFPVRSKNQYRLFLRSGEVVAVGFTTEGPKITMLRFGVRDADLRIPIAWDSSVADNGQEWITAVWDRHASLSGIGGVVGTIPDSRRLYRLDYGWGFDGRTFDSYFELIHNFPTQGYTFNTIERVRMHGLGYGIASLQIKSSGLEVDYDQPYHRAVQDISMPVKPVVLYNQMQPVTSIIDQANWGLGIKLMIKTSLDFDTAAVEPKHICQVLQLHTQQGVNDI